MALETAIVIAIILGCLLVFLPATIYLTFVFVVCCRNLCRDRSGEVLQSTPIVVTSQTHHVSGPYPVSVQHPGVGGMPPPAGVMGGAYPPQPYSPQPYPPQQYPPTGMPQPQPQTGFGGVQMPQPHQPGFHGMPQPTQAYPPYPVNTSATPYPPAGPPASIAHPPSYDQAVSGEAYQKQSPYNPNYSG